jgi:hypothetical protein
MRLVVRLFLLVLGIAFAATTGAVVLAVGLIAEAAARDLLGALGLAGVEALLSDLAAGRSPDGAAAFVRAVGTGLFALLVAPPALAALVGEGLGLRSFVWYGGAAGALTAGLPWLLRTGPSAEPALRAEGRLTVLLFLAGAASGLTYWLVAGRSAGRPAEPPPYSSPNAPR